MRKKKDYDESIYVIYFTVYTAIFFCEFLEMDIDEFLISHA